MTEPRIVTPKEAQSWLDARTEFKAAGLAPLPARVAEEFAHTVATEPDRTRAAVVKALREVSREYAEGAWQDSWLAFGVNDDVSAVQATDKWFSERADEIENGADW